MRPARARGLVLAAACWAGASLAGPPEPERIDPARSEAGIRVDMRVGGDVDGRFDRVEGELRPAGPGLWQVEVRLDAGGLAMDGPEWRARMTRSEKFLDVANHPRIRFVSRPFPRALLREGGLLAGELHLRGQVRGVTFRLDPSRCDAPGHGCPLRVHGGVRRRDFGMDAYRLWVQDEVAFDFRVRLRHAGAP